MGGEGYKAQTLGNSPMLKKSITINRHETSISIEEEFWHELKEIAENKKISINQLVANIDKTRTKENLSSAIRVYILNEMKK